MFYYPRPKSLTPIGTLELAVTPEEAERWAKVDCDDPEIPALIRSGMDYVEGVCRQPVFAAGYRVSVPGFCDGELPGVNLGEDAVTQVRYRLAGAFEFVTLTAPGSYYLLDNVIRFDPEELPEGCIAEVEITYTAGFTTAQMPENIKLAIALFIKAHYDDREGVNFKKTEAALTSLLMPYMMPIA